MRGPAPRVRHGCACAALIVASVSIIVVLAAFRPVAADADADADDADKASVRVSSDPMRAAAAAAAAAITGVTRTCPLIPEVPNTCGPSFFIVGAYKASTTSLHEYLGRHPDVRYRQDLDTPTAYLKESQALRDARHAYQQPPPRGGGGRGGHAGGGERRRAAVIRDFYARRFAALGPAEGLITGEATPNALGYPYGARSARLYFPEARIVGVLRRPVPRIWSRMEHLQALNCGPQRAGEPGEARRLEQARPCEQVLHAVHAVDKELDPKAPYPPPDARFDVCAGDEGVRGLVDTVVEAELKFLSYCLGRHVRYKQGRPGEPDAVLDADDLWLQPATEGGSSARERHGDGWKRGPYGPPPGRTGLGPLAMRAGEPGSQYALFWGCVQKRAEQAADHWPKHWLRERCGPGASYLYGEADDVETIHRTRTVVSQAIRMQIVTNSLYSLALRYWRSQEVPWRVLRVPEEDDDEDGAGDDGDGEDDEGDDEEAARLLVVRFSDVRRRPCAVMAGLTRHVGLRPMPESFWRDVVRRRYSIVMAHTRYEGLTNGTIAFLEHKKRLAAAGKAVSHGPPRQSAIGYAIVPPPPWPVVAEKDDGGAEDSCRRDGWREQDDEDKARQLMSPATYAALTAMLKPFEELLVRDGFDWH